MKRSLYDQYMFNVAKSPLHEDVSRLPTTPAAPGSVRFIAYYLPQYHAIPENDAAWGAGFTEWTNVTKALPRYLGHQQPRMPADLGFYDLRQAETLRRQADLARRGGVHGFCIHNYWFSGRQVLETPLRVLLAHPDIDLPFCLNWANESWSRRWDGSEESILLEQRYDPGDDLRYVESILPALRDPRYIRIDGRPLMMLYRPGLLPDAKETVARWRTFLTQHGIGDPYIVMAQGFEDVDPRRYGMDAAVGFPPHNGGWQLPNERNAMQLFDSRFQGHVASYAGLARNALSNRSTEYRQIPGVSPRWDNEARKPGRGFSFYGSTPAAYGSWLKQAADQAAEAPSADERLVFINAWNEWAEGAYLEPDRHFGYAYLAETRRVHDDVAAGRVTPRPDVGSSASQFMQPRPSTRRRAVYEVRRLLGRALRVGRPR